MTLISVILSGGSGSRLWAVFRQAFPTLFVKTRGSKLLQQMIERGQVCGTENAILVKNRDYLFVSRDIFAELSGAPHPHYLIEPNGRNAAPAIALAAPAYSKKYGADAIMRYC